MLDSPELMRLGIDHDGAVADFNSCWMERYNRDFGADLHHSQVVRWDGLHKLTHFASVDSFWEWARAGSTSICRPVEGATDVMDWPVFQEALVAWEADAQPG